jgi:muramidase (phage lysozyme)
MSRITADQAGGSNIVAFLDTIANSEGTEGKGDDGYNMIVSPGGFFTSYADHPRKLVQVRPGLQSTAAGRYQILEHNFDVYKTQLKLPDFGPLSQDLIAIQMIKECRAIQLLQVGQFDEAVYRCSSRWASFPGNNDDQPEVALAVLHNYYLVNGGTISPPIVQAANG